MVSGRYTGCGNSQEHFGRAVAYFHIAYGFTALQPWGRWHYFNLSPAFSLKSHPLHEDPIRVNNVR
jgi:hypothetical protein